MRERPEGAALLRQARALLLDGLLARLPEGHPRYEARLVANAVAIAARELEAGDTPLRTAAAALADLFGEPIPPEGADSSESLEEAVQRLSWRLAAELRGGQRDGDARVHQLLKDSARARLSLVNPKALGKPSE